MAEPILELDGPAGMIRWAREQAGLSQTDLGELMNISRVQINRWECGVYCPTADSFIEAIQACGFDVVLQPKEESE